jgi:hypothetical protein
MNALDEFGTLVDGYVINQCILEAGDVDVGSGLYS